MDDLASSILIKASSSASRSLYCFKSSICVNGQHYSLGKMISPPAIVSAHSFLNLPERAKEEVFKMWRMGIKKVRLTSSVDALRFLESCQALLLTE